MYVCNAFSLQMLGNRNSIAVTTPLTKDEARELVRTASVVSAIGHADTAAKVSSDLGLSLQANRVSIKLLNGEKMLVAQFPGGRLPEGTTALSPGVELEYDLVRVYYPTLD